MPPLQHADIQRFVKGRLLDCKRWPFSLQNMAFCIVIDGFSERDVAYFVPGPCAVWWPACFVSGLYLCKTTTVIMLCKAQLAVAFCRQPLSNILYSFAFVYDLSLCSWVRLRQKATGMLVNQSVTTTL